MKSPKPEKVLFRKYLRGEKKRPNPNVQHGGSTASGLDRTKRVQDVMEDTGPAEAPETTAKPEVMSGAELVPDFLGAKARRLRPTSPCWRAATGHAIRFGVRVPPKHKKAKQSK